MFEKLYNNAIKENARKILVKNEIKAVKVYILTRN